MGRENFFFLPSACHLFSRGVIFTRARVLLALLSLREKRGTTRGLLFSLPNLYPPCSFPLIVPRALSYSSLSPVSHRHKMKLKQQRRLRPRKRHLKSEFALPQTLLHLFHFVEFVKCWQYILELNSKGLYQAEA